MENFVGKPVEIMFLPVEFIAQAILFSFEFVHFMAAQNFPQGATDDDNQHEGQPGKIPEQIELTHLYRLSNVGATFRSDRTPESIVT